MKIGILGAGNVSLTIAGKLLEYENNVMISSRDLNAKKDKGVMGMLPSPKEWKEEMETKGLSAETGSFADAAEFGQVLFNCLNGVASIEVLGQIPGSTLADKILIDIANPLDFSRGMPPSLTVCNTNSLGEQIQELLPATKVVKTLNTVTASLMVNPGFLAEDHTVFLAGNDRSSKSWVETVLLREWFGWKNVIDLGTIEAARGTEMYLALWVRMMAALKISNFNIKIIKPGIQESGR